MADDAKMTELEFDRDWEVAIINNSQVTFADFQMLVRNREWHKIVCDIGFTDIDALDIEQLDAYFDSMTPANFKGKIDKYFSHFIRQDVTMRNYYTGDMVTYHTFYSSLIGFTGIYIIKFNDEWLYIDYDNEYNYFEDAVLFDIDNWFLERFEHKDDQEHWDDPYFQLGRHVLLAMAI